MLLPRAVETITCMKPLAHSVCPGNGVSYLFLAFGQYADAPRLQWAFISHVYESCA